MSSRRAASKPLKRKVGTRPELRTFLIFCEGSTSEPDYIKGLKATFEVARRTSVNIVLHPEQGVPLTLVKLAIQEKKKLEAKGNLEVDQFWCIFDVEWPKKHPNLAQAVELANCHGISLAISNPCFELWLILHYKDYTKCSSTAVVEKISKALDGRSGKSIDASLYLPHFEDAMRRAMALDSRHSGNGTKFPKDNPSSSMHALLTALLPEKPRRVSPPRRSAHS